MIVSLDQYREKVVKLSQLKHLSIKFEQDVYTLAKWIVVNDLANSKLQSTSQRISISNTTIKGLSNKFAYMTGLECKVVESHFTQAGFYLGAILKDDES